MVETRSGDLSYPEALRRASRLAVSSMETFGYFSHGAVKWNRGIQESVADLILWISCPMVLPCGQKGEWPTKEADVRHGRKS